MKNKKGLWLSLAILVFTTGLVIFAYDSTLASASVPTISQEILDLNLNGSCLDCHVAGLPDTTWYCHSVLPTENYGTRMYLGDHIDWITSHEAIPDYMIMPLAPVLPEDEAQVHLFDRRLLQSFSNITVGTTVTWTNLDIRDHTLLSQTTPGKWPFESIVLKTGESFSYTFEQAGVFNYWYEYVEFRPSTTPIYGSVGGKITVLEPRK